MKPSASLLGSAIALLLGPSVHVLGQVVSFDGTSELTFIEGTRTGAIDQQSGPPTGPYSSYGSKITLSGDSTTTTLTGLFGTPTVTSSTGDATSSEASYSATTVISGSVSYVSTIIVGGNVTQTSTAAQPTNTQACNNYVEFCSRKYSNITYIAAHNSPFVRPGNSGSNQALPVRDQLNDGIRLIQAQIQWPVNGTEPHFCHTSCDLLDAGPIGDWLGEVVSWVEEHPYDVVTILLGNGNYSDPSLLVPYIERTGIVKYAYSAPYLPMALNDWPTLEDMIIRGKRVVIFLDYMADQVKYPWLLDEFSQMWESPFDPLDRDFPCTVQRPPDLAEDAARNRLYMLNHNLNVEFNVFGAELLVPAVSLLNETNNVTGFGSLGLSANNCRSDWGRAPNFLNVDYYNYGGFPGSVFEVAARVNNVTYDRDCCGVVSGASTLVGTASWALLAGAVLWGLML
ncbi:hypothetical protein HJFPF1_03703 [Paramyrothecium foliicola]|nr:hypothetical protein HJFPF1_03703 [Paramyrothecium foliicola]